MSDDTKAVKSAWLMAVFSVLVLWGLGNLALGVSSQILHANGIIYTCSIFIASAWVLLAYGGPGALSKETLRSVETWAYGLVLIIGFIVSFALFSFVTVAEGAFLQRASIIASVIASWLLLARPPTCIQKGGMLAILVGIIILCADLPDENKGKIYALVIVFSMLQAARVFIAELHKTHSKAATMTKDPRARSRVVGYVMFVVAVLFLAASFVGALIHAHTGEILMAGMPTLADFTHAPSILFGLLVGAVVIAPIRVIEFSSSHVIKAENYLAIAALAPFAALFWEWATHPITGLSLKNFSQTDVIAGVVITFGGLFMALGKYFKKEQKQEAWRAYISYESQDFERVQDSRDLVASTLEHFAGDSKKAANALGIPVKALRFIMEDDNKVIGFPAGVLKQVGRAYRQNVARLDPLTSLLNRGAFMHEMRDLSFKGSVYSALFIDLDKFKPVNDTYGHKVGDEVLICTAKRILESAPVEAISARLGGDEFAMLLPGKNKQQAQTLANTISTRLKTPFDIAGESIEVGASIGIASYPTDAKTPEDVLKVADKGMYSDKASH
mgnify:CR=1 FL=1